MIYSKQQIEKIEEYCLNKLGAYETRPFGEYPICYRVMGKIFAQMNPQENFYKITLKTTPDQAMIYRQLYPDVIVRGYHCPTVQQPHWNTVDLEQFENEDMLFQMIDEAYDIIVQKLTKKARAKLSLNSSYVYRFVSNESKDFEKLCLKLDEYLNEIAGGEHNRSEYIPYNKRESIDEVLIVYDDEKPIACGGFKFYDEERAELKRIYVEAEYENQGIGAEIIRRLEAKAKIKGYSRCILETGEPLVAACILYKKMGYKPIENYGPYMNLSDSICMGRKI